MKKLLALSLLGVLVLPFGAHAATYHYIDLAGTVHSVEATSATEALNYVISLPNTLHTGVALDFGILEAGQDFSNLYQYRTVNGTDATVRAATLDAAFMLATDRAADSGLMMIAGPSL